MAPFVLLLATLDPKWSYPMGPCNQIVYTLAPKYLYRDYLKANVYTVWVHGPLGRCLWNLVFGGARSCKPLEYGCPRPLIQLIGKIVHYLKYLKQGKLVWIFLLLPTSKLPLKLVATTSRVNIRLNIRANITICADFCALHPKS